MFDIGGTELIVIGITALIVVGPKDLPVLFRNVGRFVGKAKSMAREFSSAMNDAADQAGVRDLQKSLKSAGDPIKSSMDSVREAAEDATRDAGKLDLDPQSETGKLAAERAEAAQKIRDNAARVAQERIDREAAAAAEAEAETPEPTPTKDTTG